MQERLCYIVRGLLKCRACLNLGTRTVRPRACNTAMNRGLALLQDLGAASRLFCVYSLKDNQKMQELAKCCKESIREIYTEQAEVGGQ